MIAFRSHRRAAVAFLGVALLWPAPAGAFETLAGLLRAVPATAGSDGHLPSFDFGSPSLQAGWPVRSLQTAVVEEFNMALIDRERGLETVGIAFPDLDAVLRFGEPPATTIYLAGAAIITDDVRTALLARPDMIEGEAGVFATFAAGDDYAIFPDRAEISYPFGGGWRAYRVAVRDGFLIEAFATHVLTDAITAVGAAAAGATDSPVAAMIEAAATLVPEGFAAYAASGLPGEAIFRAADPMPEYGLVVASVDGNWEGTQFVLLFADETTAAAGAVALATALQAIPDWPEAAKVNVGTVPAGDRVVAAVTVLFEPGTPDHPSSFLLNRWRQGIWARALSLVPAP